VADGYSSQTVEATMENIAELKSYLNIPRDIVITSHRNPDGDAIGSSLGLYHYLLKNGHAVHVAFPSDYPESFGWMKGSDKILIHDTYPERVDDKLKKADVVFCLDYNGLDRIDKMGEVIGGVRAKKVMIDHHLYPDNFVDYMLSDTTASSTCELIYDFLEMLGVKDEIDLNIGESIFVGMVTDTGSFRYATSPKLFRIVANLVDLGVDDYKIQNLIHNSLTIKNLNLLGHCLNNRMEIIEEFKTGIIVLTKKDYETFDIQRGDTEGIVNYLMMLQDVHVAAFITEQPTIVKLSLRSKGDISVQEICKKHFRGGGHKNASGGASYSSLSATVRKFKELLPEYKDKILAYSPFEE